MKRKYFVLTTAVVAFVMLCSFKANDASTEKLVGKSELALTSNVVKKSESTITSEKRITRIITLVLQLVCQNLQSNPDSDVNRMKGLDSN